MKKIKGKEGMYLYKGVQVKKTNSGNYVARFYVNSIGGQCRVCGSTQANFKKIFNDFIKQHNGLRK